MIGEDAVREVLARTGLAETELGAVGATIARRDSGAAPTGVLPSLPVDDLALDREIGRGGMGVVRLAQQRSIGREVAIKTTLANDARTARALVREARIMGALEHPSLVPVHALGVANGGPALVMKRVEGVVWRDLIYDDAHEAWVPLLAGHGDRLRAHVDILVQLCRALAFAHERGIVHRDLKPENVIVGRYGEVVLLDWGVAIALADREKEAPSIVGTPGYLAPEMAKGDPTLVDARTDVYLLGATLYEVLTRKMIHDSPNAIAAISSALMDDPPPMPGAPRELAALVTRACDRDPEKRPPSAEAFRESLVRFLAERDTDALVRDAERALDRAAEQGLSSPGAMRSLIEARFGLASALKMRAGDAEITAAMDRALRASIERELALRSPEAARVLLAELASPSAELERAIESLERELEAERRDAHAHATTRREADARKAVGPLSLVVIVGSGVGTIFSLFFVPQALESGYPVHAALASDALAIVIASLIFFLARRALLATAGTRRLTASYLVWGWSIVLSDVVSYLLGRDVREAATHSMVVGACVCAALSLQIAVLRPIAMLHAVTAAVLLAFPESHPVSVLVALIAVTALFVRAFRREGARSTAGEAG